MIYEVFVLPRAQRDLLRLSAFLVDKSPNSAVKARLAITAGIESLETMPERGAPGPTTDTRALFVRFGVAGYDIRYRIVGQGVLVSRIFHTREKR